MDLEREAEALGITPEMRAAAAKERAEYESGRSDVLEFQWWSDLSSKLATAESIYLEERGGVLDMGRLRQMVGHKKRQLAAKIQARMIDRQSNPGGA